MTVIDPRVGVIGLVINIDCGVSLDEATSIVVTIIKPDGTEYDPITATVTGENIATITCGNVFDVAGRYIISPLVNFNDNSSIYGSAADLYIYERDAVVQ